MNFSEEIKTKLKQCSLSSAELAKRMEYTPQYVSDLLLGKRRWNEDTMSKACEALDIELSIIEHRTNPTNSTMARGT